MRYYVIADPHGFYTETRKALEEAGFFADTRPHKLIICGDLLDRGGEPQEMVNFVMDLMDKNQVILIKGNHEDLFQDLVLKDDGRALHHHRHNGTWATAVQLTGMELRAARRFHSQLAERGRKTDFYRYVMPMAKDYYETEHYIFVHGWVPCNGDEFTGYTSFDWREISDPFAKIQMWESARWINGMRAAHDGVKESGKTVVCGHHHTSFGHANYEYDGPEFGERSIFTPYYGDGIIALDACTAYSGFVNCIVLED